MGPIKYQINTDDINAKSLLDQLNILRENQVKTIFKKDGAPYDISIRGQHIVSIEFVPNEIVKSAEQKELEELRADVAALKAQKEA